MHQLYDVYDYSELAPLSFGPSVTGRGKSWTVFVLYASCSSIVLISVGVLCILGTSVLCSDQWPPSNITWYRLLFCWLCLSIYWENIAVAVMSTCYFSIMHYFCYHASLWFISVYYISLRTQFNWCKRYRRSRPYRYPGDLDCQRDYPRHRWVVFRGDCLTGWWMETHHNGRGGSIWESYDGGVMS